MSERASGFSLSGVISNHPGVEVMHSCREGICGACEVRVLEGTPDHRDSILSDAEKQAGKTIFVCCSGSKTSRMVLDL
ncbi:2Fe-2S iron-sulfur cluster-binding protein [Pseudomonas batumici]|nr:2Fe-2S iron-sulfur cluster binding domain-containing protein [Pseudomonas batumici]